MVLFAGSSHALVPLFAVGVFLAWTLSQSGMVLHWRRERGRRWRLKALLNGIGALATLVTFLIVGVFKFFDGAWIALILVPILVLLFIEVRKRRMEMEPEFHSSNATSGN
jgi:amino acid transporter